MASPVESGLALTYDDLRSELGFFGGYGRTSTVWNAGAASNIAHALKVGLRRFYYPTRLPGQPRAYQWRFLKPIATIQVFGAIAADTATPLTKTVTGGPFNTTLNETLLTATAASDDFVQTMAGYASQLGSDGYGYGTGRSRPFGEFGDHYIFVNSGALQIHIKEVVSPTEMKVWGDASAVSASEFRIETLGNYQLPDRVGLIEGSLTFGPSDNATSKIPVRDEMTIRELRSRGVKTGVPQFAAVVPILTKRSEFDTQVSTRFILMLWPTPGGVYNLSFRFHANVDNISSADPYPHGAHAHSETILQSVLAAFETEINQQPGVHSALYLERLQVSMEHDKVAFSPEHLGINADFSDAQDHGVSRSSRRDRQRTSGSGITTYNGVAW